MAAPHPSYVIHPDTTIPSGYKTYHCMSGGTIDNSHGIICRTHRIPEDEVLKVEIWGKNLRDGKEPTPWGIDRLPIKYKYAEDLPAGMVEAAEYAAQKFMTPGNIYAYITNNYHDACKIISDLFNDRYVTDYMASVGTARNSSDGPLYTLAAIAQQFTGTKTTSVSTRPNMNKIPMFTLTDIRNPAVWLELPKED
jgi:hypothetical protein